MTNKKTFINIEMKTPWLEEPRAQYNMEEAAEAVHKLIREYDLGEYCLISSFNHGNIMLPTIDKLNEQTGYHVRTIYLHNFYPEDELPPISQLVTQGDGINISYEALTKELVDTMHAHGKLISVWIDAGVTRETEQVYQRLIDLGVDCFCSDFPLEVSAKRDQLMMEASISSLGAQKKGEVSEIERRQERIESDSTTDSCVVEELEQMKFDLGELCM